MNEQVEKIKKELERRLKSGCVNHYEYTAYESIISFIDSLRDTDRQILTAKDVGEIFNRVKTCAVKWSATEAAYPEVAEWWNNGHKQNGYDPEYLQSCIDKTTADGSWKGVDVDEYMDDVRGKEDKHYYSWLDLEERQND